MAKYDLRTIKWNQDIVPFFHSEMLFVKNTDEEAIERATKIINGKLPVLAVSNDIIKEIAKEIYEGNYQSFLDLNLHKYYDEMLINAYIIGRIKDFDIFKKYLDQHLLYADNWSVIDQLPINIKHQEDKYFLLAKEYIKSDKTFTRRMGYNILRKFVKNEKYINEIYQIIDQSTNETEYYVNMMISWLVCELFIHHRDLTIEYLNHHHLNKFVINKAISKCHDSLRISKEDKQLLNQYKI